MGELLAEANGDFPQSIWWLIVVLIAVVIVLKVVDRI